MAIAKTVIKSENSLCNVRCNVRYIKNISKVCHHKLGQTNGPTRPSKAVAAKTLSIDLSIGVFCCLLIQLTRGRMCYTEKRQLQNYNYFKW